MKIKKTLINILILCILLIPISLLGVLINKSTKEQKNTTKVESVEESVNVDEKINIALFGLDRRNEDEKASS
ncbi:MAG: hypothetical protein ACRCX2_35400 [Paraclostridium sp.]